MMGEDKRASVRFIKDNNMQTNVSLVVFLCILDAASLTPHSIMLYHESTLLYSHIQYLIGANVFDLFSYYEPLRPTLI